MRKKVLYLNCIILMLICQVLTGFRPVGAANVNNFYFESFVGDYYLSKDGNGVSRLKVEEEVTAVFPDYNQNKGICRQISYTNQGGVNTTLPNLNRSNLTLTRNGAREPIYSIEKDNGYYNVCTGDETYVTGRQVYKFVYEFEKVVTEFDNYQELYWDTNGNGATQRFEKVVARVHFGDAAIAEAFDGGKWCYVGKYGESGQDRCVISEISDGWKFEATNLAAHENLTFDVEFESGTFVVPEPDKDYSLVIGLVVVTVGCVLLLILVPGRRFWKVREKREYYRGLFVKPEYQPHKEYGVGEMAAVYMGKKENDKVAVLLEMIVGKKIAIYQAGEGAFGKKKWGIEVLNEKVMLPEEKDLVQILNGGSAISDGEKFEVKSRSATSKLIKLGRDFEEVITKKAKADGLGEEKFKAPEISGSVLGAVMMVLVMVGFLAVPVAVGIMDGADISNLINMTNGSYMVGGVGMIVAIAVVVTVTVAIWSALSVAAHKYAVRTKKGMEMSRYMDGLKLYIGMAEAERMKLLQSVEGADTSANGVVKLYEKLLPYAAVFGLEKTWMGELAKYYEMSEVTEPDWYRSGITPMDMIVMSHLMSDYSRTATTMASSGGSSSSGFSGGGGGGFSGGGGGGGGFSGR